MEAWLANELRPWFADRVLDVDEDVLVIWRRLEEQGKRLGKNPSAIDLLVFPGGKPGSIVPPYELVVVGKLLQLLKKFGAAEAWVPAFAGKAGAEIANF